MSALDAYLVKDGKPLRLGYTTGSCAAAAAKAAAWMLLTGHRKPRIRLLTPKGIALDLPVLDICQTPEQVSCAIEKDSGDDPDSTNGVHIVATVSFTDQPGIQLQGGPGVGRVTRRGLDQPVGEAAINTVPRQMILDNVAQVCRLTDYPGGLRVVLSVPGGEALAQRTFNPRLGIVGGISILGTTGIVEPMSEQALVDTIAVELRQRRSDGADTALLTPGNYGASFLRDRLGADPDRAVLCSNFIGDALHLCQSLSFPQVLLAGHLGKLVKCAGGMRNTHSKYGDCRMEILAAHAAACGLPAPAAEELLTCVTCDDALRVLDEHHLRTAVLDRVLDKILFHLRPLCPDAALGVILYSNSYGLLAQSANAPDLLRRCKEV